MSPKRIQLRRTKGWHRPEGSVNVARPTVWGNPFKVGEPIPRSDSDPRWAYIVDSIPGGPAGFSSITPMDRQIVVDAYSRWIIESPWHMLNLYRLRGKDLCCYCPLDQPCHADVLLELVGVAVSPDGGE